MTDDDEQARLWAELYDRIAAVLQRHGTEDPHARADYFVFDDNWGGPEQRVEINNLAMLRPPIVKELQGLLREYPDWKIVVAVDVRGKETEWPPMGLIVRAHEIIDGLQRQYLPEAFRDLRYEGSRPGTASD
ncbi:MAG: hypothetical protein HXX10_15680 [Rhodoplanes sp.]|uniref:hypothetical protein n=1 Tax=Rhodoplanes sp. TaxID=1968906 RepID=UPI0017F14F1C|nr:hypothetical protein [Rhodoplanes sp.]NVO15470.1 hypothetical protein [Rhodoplanes sp.]